MPPTTTDVTPEKDLREHIQDDACPCRPRIEVMAGTGNRVRIHNSWDGREILESVEKMINDAGIDN